MAELDRRRTALAGGGGSSRAGEQVSAEMAVALTLTGRGGSVNLTLPLATWLGLADRPGDVAGLGPVDAGTCRDLAGRLAAGPAATLCLTLTDPGGRAAAHACAKNAPGRTATARPANITRQ